MLRLAISSALLNMFFSETLHDNLPVRCAGQATRSIDEKNCFVKEGDRVTRLEFLADWAEKYFSAQNIFFCPISGTEFDHFWNWFGKNKFPGALELFK